MDINDCLDNRRHYRWLQRAFSEQVLLLAHCFKRSNESIDTSLNLECLESGLADSLSERDRLLSKILSLKESLRLMQKDEEENS